MAVLTQIQLEGSSTVYDINDARISATSVATATHFLATNSGVSAINPISAADLASVLGGSASSATQSVSEGSTITISWTSPYSAVFYIQLQSFSYSALVMLPYHGTPIIIAANGEPEGTFLVSDGSSTPSSTASHGYVIIRKTGAYTSSATIENHTDSTWIKYKEIC